MDSAGSSSSLTPVLLMGGGIVFVWYYFRHKLRQRRIEKFTQKYGDREVALDIVNKKIWQGMTTEMLKDSWGKPVEIDRKVLKTKTKEIYKYSQTGKNRFANRVIVENENVVGWDLKGR